MPNTRIAVIMAGGSGERFWPLSRRRRPKQLLNLTDPDKSLLDEAVERILPLVSPENIFVATSRHLQEAIRQADLGLPAANIIAEPSKRNTAGCLVYAAATALQRLDLPPQEVTMAVLTADQQMKDPEAFRATVAVALEAAEQDDALVTIGIRPTRPETGYGYIEMANQTTPTPGSTPGVPVFPVLRFTEKPDLQAVEGFLEAGNFLWNSGMFFWRLSTFLDAFQQASPVHATAIHELVAAMDAVDAAAVDTVFNALPNTSIDYALMERAESVRVVPASFPWDDVGAWDSLDRTFARDLDGNVVFGDPIVIDSENSIIYNEPGAEAMAVAVIGVRDLVVVVSPDGVLVVPKDRVQSVKEAVEMLKERNASQL